MGIAGNANLISAQATYLALYQELFANGPSGVAALIAQTVPVSGKRLSVPVVTSFPRLREWIGSRVSKDLRAFRQDIDIKTYEATTTLPRLDVDADQSGAVGAHLRSFLASAASQIDDVMIAGLIANTQAGYDGVSLLNASHPFSSSTGNNLTTDALGFASFRAAKAAMRAFADEDGRPLGVNPTHMLVGPQLERTALEVVGADRPVPYSASAQDASSSIVAATTITNVYQGECQVIVSPWITGNQWFLMDLSKPGLRPITRAVYREVEPVETQVDGMSSYLRFEYDEYAFALEGDFTFAPGLWQLIYGRVAV